MANLPPSENAGGGPARGAVQALQPPYPAIADLLASGGVVPFLGAGASLTNRTGAWTEDAAFYPLGSELARYLAGKATFPDSEPEHVRADLARMASFAEHVQLDRNLLNKEIRKIFCRKLEPGRLHRMLAEIKKPLMIITTNYDTLLEQAFEERKRPFHLIIYHGNKLWYREPDNKDFVEQVPRKIDINFEENDAPVIYKMHGSVDIENKDNDYFLITEEDYVDFLATQSKGIAIPQSLVDHLTQGDQLRFLFLGYGLQDWNFRVMLQRLRNKAQRAMARSWALQVGLSEIEKRLWAKQDVNNYDLEALGMTMEDFVEKLAERLK